MKMYPLIKWLPIGLLSLLLFGAINGSLHFGYGLGDLSEHIAIYVVWLVYFVYIIIITNHKLVLNKWRWVMPILTLLFVLYILLAMTVWVGPEW